MPDWATNLQKGALKALFTPKGKHSQIQGADDGSGDRARGAAAPTDPFSTPEPTNGGGSVTTSQLFGRALSPPSPNPS